jgi:2-polyprenyl-6-methoxyphenol hydroxylase-like FAD-dependent oxidoreductase
VSEQAARDAPVVVAGAGPVGLAIALGLARHGVRSIVLEKAAVPAPFARAGVVLARTLEIFRAWGIVDDVRRECIAPDRLEACDAANGRTLARLDFDVLRSESLEPGPVFLAQQRTEAILLEHARRSGLSEIRFGHEVTGFQQFAGGVAVEVRPVEAEPYVVRAPFLAGADGAASTVRALLGLKLEGETYPNKLMLAVVHIDDERDALPWPRLRLDTAEYLAALRFAPQRWRVIAALAPGESDAEALAPAAIARRVVATLGAGPFETEWASTFAIHRRRAANFVVGRVLLAGDAAHLNSPVGAQGLNAGIADAHNLVWKLAGALRGGDWIALLASYERERRFAIVNGTERVTDPATKLLLRSGTRLRRLVLASAGFLLRVKSLRRRVLRTAMMLDVRYERSPLLFGTGPCVGARAPDPALAATDRATLVLCGFAPGQLEAPALPDGVALLELDSAAAARWRTRAPFAAFVRPDGYVGWLERAPPRASIERSVRVALGFQGEEGGAPASKATGR